MIERISRGCLKGISSQDFQSYASIFVDVEEDYRRQVEALGLPFANRAPVWLPDEALCGCGRERRPLIFPALAARVGNGLRIENDGRSYVCGWLSGACASCRLGLGSKTYIISTMCPRDCFFCFNPNQLDFDELQNRVRDVSSELEQDFRRGAKLGFIALTGGEPLLHKDETLTFLTTARRLFPEAHLRLYTSGAFLDEPLMTALSNSGLDEIRFSIKTEDDPASIEETLGIIRRCVHHIPDVMVEMPVVPGELEIMKRLLLRLDQMGARGMNLLELGYPLANAEEFRKRGLRIKAEPLRVLYDYSYAGGLPIEGSEEECLSLLEFALDSELRMGVHYCSMENKFSGQVYQQNAPHADRFPTCTMSKRDYFLKSAKVFGEEAARAERLLAAMEKCSGRLRGGDSYIEFPPDFLPSLKQDLPDAEVALSYGIVERRGAEWTLRELRVDRTTPATFDVDLDV